MQCDLIVEERSPDIVFVEKKKKEIKTLDVVGHGDVSVGDKEIERIKKEKKKEGLKDLGDEDSHSNYLL